MEIAIIDAIPHRSLSSSSILFKSTTNSTLYSHYMNYDQMTWEEEKTCIISLSHLSLVTMIIVWVLWTNLNLSRSYVFKKVWGLFLFLLLCSNTFKVSDLDIDLNYTRHIIHQSWIYVISSVNSLSNAILKMLGSTLPPHCLWKSMLATSAIQQILRWEELVLSAISWRPKPLLSWVLLLL